MSRSLAAKLSVLLAAHAGSRQYATRSVEYLLTWVMISWSAMVLAFHLSLSGTPFFGLLAFMPASLCATLGLIVGGFRLYALIRNGGWSRSPWLRLLGASTGFQFWLVVTLTDVWHVTITGTTIYPMLGVFPVFIFFEAYSCFRCGQDAKRASMATTLADRGHGRVLA